MTTEVPAVEARPLSVASLTIEASKLQQLSINGDYAGDVREIPRTTPGILQLTGIPGINVVAPEPAVNVSFETAGKSLRVDDDVDEYWKNNIRRINGIVVCQLYKIRKRNRRALTPPKVTSKALKTLLELHDRNEEEHEKFKRLEYVGDRVMNYMLSKLMIEQYPETPRGVVSFLRDRLVSNKQMHHYAMAYNLPGAKHLDELGGEKAVSDIFEAYLGAIEKQDGHMTTRVQSWISEIFQSVVSTLVFRGLIEQLDSNIEELDPLMMEHIQELQKVLTDIVDSLPITVISIPQERFSNYVLGEFKTKHFYDLEALFEKMNA